MQACHILTLRRWRPEAQFTPQLHKELETHLDYRSSISDRPNNPPNKQTSSPNLVLGAVFFQYRSESLSIAQLSFFLSP